MAPYVIADSLVPPVAIPDTAAMGLGLAPLPVDHWSLARVVVLLVCASLALATGWACSVLLRRLVTGAERDGDRGAQAGIQRKAPGVAQEPRSTRRQPRKPGAP